MDVLPIVCASCDSSGSLAGGKIEEQYSLRGPSEKLRPGATMMRKCAFAKREWVL
jgi:hypothetical protein